MLAALRANDRAAALHAALEAYFGPPKHAPKAGIPKPLAALFAWFDAGMIRQNQLSLPGERGVFYVENQSVNEWALADETDDPFIFRDNEVVEREPLSGFALQIVLFEASMGALPFSAAGSMGNAARARMQRLLTKVPLEPWTWPMDPTRFYVSEGIVAHTTQSDDETWIFLSALSAQHLEPFSAVEGVTSTSFGVSRHR